MSTEQAATVVQATDKRFSPARATRAITSTGRRRRAECLWLEEFGRATPPVGGDGWLLGRIGDPGVMTEIKGEECPARHSHQTRSSWDVDRASGGRRAGDGQAVQLGAIDEGDHLHGEAETG
jgi:hypothetical protein